MAATLLTPPVLAAQYTLLFTFCQNAWELNRKARKQEIAPTDADAYTLTQTDATVEQANVEAVLIQLKQLKAMIVKVDDGLSEMEFALNLLADRAYRKPPLPSSIEGPHFDTVTTVTP